MSNQKREREEDARDKNRKAVSDRPKQWETVGSDDSESESEERPRKHHDKDDSSTESSEESSKESIEKHKSKKHKTKDDKKEKKEKKHKKEKKEKKHKKEKKKHKEHTSSSSSSSSSSSTGNYAVDQNQFGKYGIIREDSYFHKQREFEKYMDEVKHMPNVLNQCSKREVMTYFKDFIEDYNTATMPHIKYYNLEKWEMEDYHQQKLIQFNHTAAKKRGGVSGEDEEVQYTIADDENERRMELKHKKEMNEQQQFQSLKNQMAVDKERTEHMRRQSELQTQWQLAYKQGDTATFKKLERLLAPEEMKAVQKHPWA